MTLDCCKTGKSYTIKNFDPKDEEQLRLLELGFQCGAEVCVLQNAWLSQLLKVQVHDSSFAIRTTDAAQIEVVPQPENSAPTSLDSPLAAASA